MPLIETRRDAFAAALCTDILGYKGGAKPTMSDSSSAVSVEIGRRFLARLAAAGFVPAKGVSLKGQEVGKRFDVHVREYVDQAFVNGTASLVSVSPATDFHCRSGVHIRDTAQYAHLEILRQIGEDPAVTTSAVARQQFRAVTASDYQVQADVVVLRRPTPATTAPRTGKLYSSSSGLAMSTAVLNRRPGQHDLLHANVSCKWTFRSDRAQNIRTEAIALMRHRKGRMPHMVVVTAEPLPSRLRSIAIGTGEVDCVYHIGLDFLADALADSLAAATTTQRKKALSDQIGQFELMRDGDRLRDVSDLPFDLCS
ncbi:NgoMIV family type II restriction endonuclease [Solirubrobacter soli]|uniref:NgoMIV family type II restriction endonuclease n=1 Tax=Solirubrobacter soli TaxID=363832 RepID=UPI00040C3A40|nr:NgoMIV family type II restriction endonuclease [Solirubrobacter soli]